MSKFHSYITSATKIISTYSGGKTLTIHIRSFFAADKKFGSRDRRVISSLCYSYFRAGHAFKQYNTEQKILAGLFLCENKSNELLFHFRPDLDEKIGLAIPEKCSVLQIQQTAFFPFLIELGPAIDPALFSVSFLKQPGIYLRIRPGRLNVVEEKLEQAEVQFKKLNNECIQLESNVAADKILKLNKEAVVQDINSQQVLNYLDKVTGFDPGENKISAWDCCAASGGKSILLYDKLRGNIKLTVSDIRENILLNLSERLKQAGININDSFITDLTMSSMIPAREKFSIILCDVPCTGSGTWGRNPEQLFYFDKKTIADYAARQKKIVENTIPHLKNGGLFFYITCSVFEKENEGVVAFIKEKLSADREGYKLQLIHTEYLKGYEIAADTMFVAVFSKLISG
jgi:16S rRNA (cytosine967-C5)-methyltransferase